MTKLPAASISIQSICTLVGMQLGRRQVQPTDRLIEDLSAESVDIANLIATLDEQYHIRIDEADIPGLHTVDDLFRLVQQLTSTP